MIERIVEFLESAGYGGILLLMVVENVFPPLPSELVMPFAGFAAARGDLNGIGVDVGQSCHVRFRGSSCEWAMAKVS
jgi:membrane protein DedA with SNARE-associated domain